MRYAMQHRGQVATASGLDVLAGVWLLISPFVLAFHRFGGYAASTATSNDVILGIVIGIIALVRFFNTDTDAWLSWVNAVLGLWVLISPWVLGFSHYHVAMGNNVIFGIIVIVLACWSALATETGGGGSTAKTM